MPTNWGSRSFNGTTDKVVATSISTSLLPQANATNWTISAWANLASAAGGTTPGVAAFGLAPAGGYEAQIGAAGTGAKWQAAIHDQGAPSDIVIAGPAYSLNTWTHLALVGTSVTAMTFYVNGNGTSGTTNGNFGRVGTTNTLSIGNDASDNTNFFNGLIADVAVWNGVSLTQAEISSLAKGARPNTVRPNSLSLWYPNDGLQSPEPNLSSSVAPTGTVTGTTPAFGPPYTPFTPRWPQAPRPFIPQDGNWGSRSFNGTSDFAENTTGYSAALASSFTMAIWINPANFTTDFQVAFVMANAGGTSAVGLYTRSTSKAGYFWSGNTSSSSTISTNTWAHIGMTGVNTNGQTINCYLNGASAGSFVTTAANGALVNWNIWHGFDNAADAHYTGLLADAAIWNAVLTPSEMSALAKGARPSTIRPQNLTYWAPMDGLQSPEEDLSGGKRNLTLTGTTPAFGPPYMPLTPRWPQKLVDTAAAPTFQAAWARGKNIVIEGVAT